MTAVDYSGARFTGAQLKAKGVILVIRYLTGPFAISKAELDTLLSAGIVVCFVVEYLATDGTSGSAKGVAHAKAAAGALAALGVSATTPVYFAADSDIPNPQTGVPYFQGINSVRPAAATGAYGEEALLALLRTDGLITYTWESESTSFPGNSGPAPSWLHILQKTSGAPLADTDLDVLLQSDVGQVPRPASSAPPAPLPPAAPAWPSAPIPTTNLPEDNMKRLGPITFPALDANGNGSVQIPGAPDATEIVSVQWEVPNPNQVKVYYSPPKQWAVTTTGLLVIEGGSPGGVYSANVFVAD